MDNTITFEDVKQSEYPQENISRYIESRRPTINKWLKEKKYQLDIQRYKRPGFFKLKKQPTDPFIKINLFDMIGRNSVYYHNLEFSDKAVWIKEICDEIKKQYKGWNVEYKMKSVNARYEMHWTCHLYFKK